MKTDLGSDVGENLMADVSTPSRERKIKDGKTAEVSANLAYCARAWAEGKAATFAVSGIAFMASR
jgi:hypothetical protein